MPTLQDLLDRATAEADPGLVRREDGRLRCLACGHRCLLREGARGVCKVRFVRDGRLRAPSGYVAGLAVDPIEKKPFFHVLPGAGALSFGMLGCDLHCAYCQNWDTSQTLRDESARALPRPITAAEIVRLARDHGAPVVVSTYNEPLITADWSLRIFERAKEAGLLTGFVSNGNATPEVLDRLRPVTDLFKIDLKGFRDATYRRLGCPLQNVLDGITGVFERGFWLEVVTLVVPGLNDSDAELRDCARFLAGLSPDIPWHVTAFHPDYKLTDRGRTPAETLARARAIGLEAGLRYVYAGNLPGALEGAEDTHCAACGALLIARRGFRAETPGLDPEGRCRACTHPLPGRFAVQRR